MKILLNWISPRKNYLTVKCKFDGTLKFAVMNRPITMTYIEVLKKRLERKNAQLKELETIGDLLSTVDKRKFVELKAVIQELETVIDLAESMLDQE